jgi:hypothetical protein
MLSVLHEALDFLRKSIKNNMALDYWPISAFIDENLFD